MRRYLHSCFLNTAAWGAGASGSLCCGPRPLLFPALSLCYLWIRKGLGSDRPLKREQHPRLPLTAAARPGLPSMARSTPALRPAGAPICGEGPAWVPGAVRADKQLCRRKEGLWAAWKPHHQLRYQQVTERHL